MIPYNKRVTRLLEEKGIVDSQRLKDAATLADQRSASISTVLTELKLVDERLLLGVIAENSKIPPIDLRLVHPDPAVLAQFPQELAFQQQIFPVSRIGDVLTLAVINPYDILKLDEIRIITGCELRMVLTLEEHLKIALDKGYRAGQREVEQILGEMEKAGDLQLKEQEEDEEEKKSGDAVGGEDDDSPVVKFVNAMI